AAATRNHRQRLERVVPVLRDAAIAAPLAHREHEVCRAGLGPLAERAIQLEARWVLRRRLRHHPAIVPDREEEPQLHVPPGLRSASRRPSMVDEGCGGRATLPRRGCRPPWWRELRP